MCNSQIVDEMVHKLRIKGRATARVLADAVGCDIDSAETALAALSTRGWAVDSGNSVLGWAITPNGTAAVQAAVDALPTDARDMVSAQYGAFQRLDLTFKQLCADWQLGESTTARRETAVARLSEINAAIHQLLDQVPDVRFFANYAHRFRRAKENFTAGQDEYLTGVRVDSYHTVWFECHEEFLLVLGRSREAEESRAGYQ